MWAGIWKMASGRDVAEKAFHGSQFDRLHSLLMDVDPGSIRHSITRFPRGGGVANRTARAEIMLLVFILALCSSFVFAVSFPRQSGGNDTNNGIHLAIGPNCGSLSGLFSDVNAGLLALDSYKTIVSFGDSYTDTGGNRDGTPPPPAVVIPPNPEAGGRSSNGPMWVEDFALDHGQITVMNYAISAAVTNASLWPSRANNSDFIHQVDLFLSQSHNLDPASTLFVVFFGINDFLASQVDGDHLPQAAQTVLNQIDLLSSPPTNARSFLVLDVYGIGSQSASGDTYKQAIFSGLNARRNSAMSPSFRVAFVDFAPMWSAIIDNQPPGFKAFGYTSNQFCDIGPGPCCDPPNICPDPDHTFYWIASHPAKQGQRIMADLVNEALTQCKAS
ncbi:hypothetical protein JB92DRAFT_2917919 [Gautieria morchelliformis]|nr:hypothetical protein JB92DRAFT_2917919 [Gautieria morchelliformis]